MNIDFTGTFNNVFGSWHDAVLMLKIIDCIGSSSIALSLFITCVSWLSRKIDLVLKLLGIIFCIPARRT